ncbi:MAG: branched-chain amino acid ABC transporter permease, partial [Candidatus Methanomethyliaceae archaeon]
LAAYLTWVFMKEAGLGLVPSIIAMVVVQVLVSVFIFYKGVFERYLEEEEILLSLTVLIYLVFANLANYLYPVTAGVALPTTIIAGSSKIGATTISNQMLVTAIIGLATTALFVAFFLKTRAGLIMRAMSQNLNAAMLMGANVNLMYYLAMSLAVLPPIIATLCVAPFWGVNPQMGLPMLMTAIVIAILGGLGNLKGTIVASFLVAFIHSTVSFLYVSRFMGLAGLIVVLIVLIFRRGGIFAGERLW